MLIRMNLDLLNNFLTGAGNERAACFSPASSYSKS
jgi:hypothetical protein